jgi:hypothetical protein
MPPTAQDTDGGALEVDVGGQERQAFEDVQLIKLRTLGYRQCLHFCSKLRIIDCLGSFD